jgi:type IV pilus assembly protein PilB
MPKRSLIGEVLTETGILSAAQLRRALTHQSRTGQRLGEVVLNLGLASQEDVASALGRQLGLRFIRLGEIKLREETLLQVPEPLARGLRVFPLEVQNDTLTLGMVDPLDVVAMDDVRRRTGLGVRPAVITLDDFHRALSEYPAPDEAVEEILEEIRPAATPDGELPIDQLRVIADQAPIVRLANTLILQAIRQRASDIHVEPLEHHVRIRYRIDGTLYPSITLRKHIHAALISRLKIMANLDIAEQRLPQDGRIELKVEGRDIDFRVSTIPLIWGEKMVLRILDKKGALVTIDQLGLAPHDEELLNRIIRKPHGIVLLTGPTGSGKTTSLYAILNKLNRTEVNITTIEDPVEYQLAGITQVQVSPKAGVTFASALRAFLRQSPDIIMVGEIRDEETARIAIHASLTGHLVLSTLHTNDAPSALTRLADMGIEPFLISSAITGVIAQRLVRILCEKCKKPYTPSESVLKRAGLDATAPAPTLYEAVGCPFCNHTGYRGRTGVFEILRMDETIKALVAQGATSTAIKEAAMVAGMRTLHQAGLEKALEGKTSLGEVLRVVYVEEETPAAVGSAAGDIA